jgi:hypothetical protein
VLSQPSCRPRVRSWFDVDRPQSHVDILQRHRHNVGPAVDIDAAEELQPETWRQILALFRTAALLKLRRRAAHVDQENIQPRPVFDSAIGAAGLLGDRADRHEFEKYPALIAVAIAGTPVESQRSLSAPLDSGPKLLRQAEDSCDLRGALLRAP